MLALSINKMLREEKNNISMMPVLSKHLHVCQVPLSVE